MRAGTEPIERALVHMGFLPLTSHHWAAVPPAGGTHHFKESICIFAKDTGLGLHTCTRDPFPLLALKSMLVTHYIQVSSSRRSCPRITLYVSSEAPAPCQPYSAPDVGRSMSHLSDCEFGWSVTAIRGINQWELGRARCVRACMLSRFSHVWLFVTPTGTVACQDPLFMVFSRHEYCSGQVSMPSSRGPSPPRDRTHISYVCCISRWVLHH